MKSDTIDMTDKNKISIISNSEAREHKSFAIQATENQLSVWKDWEDYIAIVRKPPCELNFFVFVLTTKSLGRIFDTSKMQ